MNTAPKVGYYIAVLRTRHVSMEAFIWVVVGLIVAANHHFLDHATATSSKIGSAVLAVMLWPLVLFHIHVGHIGI